MEGKKIGINMQQINRDPEFRELFESEKGNKLILADYAGMELRIVAKVANEKEMLLAFDSGKDLHSYTACKLWGLNYDEFMKILNNNGHAKYKEFKELRNKA